MPNPLFNQYGGRIQNGQNSNNILQNFGAFVQNFRRNSSMTPQQKVQELLSSGQMTQEQFNQLGQMANQILGRQS